MTTERVYTTWDFYDGVRAGIADFHGKPHYFVSEWDEAADDYSEFFALAPVGEDIVSLAIEHEQLQDDWEIKFGLGMVARDSHPGLPGNNEKYLAQERTLRGMVDRIPASGIKAKARFVHATERPDYTKGAVRQLLVEWS